MGFGRIVATATVFLLGAGALWGQDELTPAERQALARIDQLEDNVGRLNIAISVDRSTPYFPYELATITVTIKNSMNAPLEIPDPNDPDMQKFNYKIKLNSKWVMAESESDYFQWPPLDKLRTTIFQPGQAMTLTFHPEEGLIEPWLDGRGRWAIGAPGSHRLVYLLGGSADYEVGKPILEASAIIPLHSTRTWIAGGGSTKTRSAQEAAMIVAVQLAGEHVLLAGGRNATTNFEIEPKKKDGSFDAAVSGAPWIRLATVPFAVTSIKATADGKDRISIQYTAGGAARTMHLDETRHPTD